MSLTLTRRGSDDELADVDVVLDTNGGETQDRSFSVLKPGGALVSTVVVVARRPHKRGKIVLDVGESH